MSGLLAARLPYLMIIYNLCQSLRPRRYFRRLLISDECWLTLGGHVYNRWLHYYLVSSLSNWHPKYKLPSVIQYCLVRDCIVIGR